MLGSYRSRSILALSLMVAQAFLFNAVFFSFGLLLTKFSGVTERQVGIYLIPLTTSNFCGPLLLGLLFDTVGRRKMIAGTYATAGLILIIAAVAFGLQNFIAWTQTLAWMTIFFFASTAASSAYLTASEIFPLEVRALAIATFYALGTAIGGTIAPVLMGYLIETGNSWSVSGGYMFGSFLMLVAAFIEARFGVDAENRPLEQIADPLSGR